MVCSSCGRANVQAAARLEGIAVLADVRWALLETTGRISVIQR